MKRSFLIITGIVTFVSGAQAYIVNGSMGREPGSSHGQCLTATVPVKLEEAKQILIKNQVKLSSNVSGKEVIAVARGVQQIESIYGKPFPGIRGARFVYSESDGVWNQSAGPIRVNRNWSTETGMHSRNIGMLMHELGHYVGNNKSSDNPASYERYFRAVPEPCEFSWYSTQKRNEEYADVFSAFVVNPTLLLTYGGDSCQRAYRFWHKVFKAGNLASCQRPSKKKTKPLR